MSNVIINKDRWQKKPKVSKANKGQSIQYHKTKEKLLSEGKTIEEVDKYFKKLAKEKCKIDKNKRDYEINCLINEYLPSLTKEQKYNLLKQINEDFTNNKLKYIEKFLIKISNNIK